MENDVKPSVVYSQLARALLDAGDPPVSVARFLRSEYGLDRIEAKEAIANGRRTKGQKAEPTAAQASSRR
jgi:hypothetical protein